MTKEELFNLNHSVGLSDEELNKFFESNVCIPKGENRHPYADVLHEWIECMSKKLQQISDTNEWLTTHNINLDRVKFNKYRIKPSEPVYEWQWLDFNDHKEGYFIGNKGFYTKQEAKEFTTYGREKCLEETKRERK